MESLEFLKNNLSYDPETGVVVRKSTGRPVTSTSSQGYGRIKLGGRDYKLHRVIWFMVYGELPDQIDHINGIRTDNRLDNLRNVSRHENSVNLKKYPNNTSGQPGVNWHKAARCWIAQIRDRGRYVYLGRFSDLQKAIAARQAAEMTYGYHANHGDERTRYSR